LLPALTEAAGLGGAGRGADFRFAAALTAGVFGAGFFAAAVFAFAAALFAGVPLAETLRDAGGFLGLAATVPVAALPFATVATLVFFPAAARGADFILPDAVASVLVLAMASSPVIPFD
jgi:hypothetical protein